MRNKILSLPFLLFSIISSIAFLSLWLGHDDPGVQFIAFIFAVINAGIGLGIWNFERQTRFGYYAVLIGILWLLFLVVGSFSLLWNAFHVLVSDVSCYEPFSESVGFCHLAFAVTAVIVAFFLIVDIIFIPRLLKLLKNKIIREDKIPRENFHLNVGVPIRRNIILSGIFGMLFAIVMSMVSQFPKPSIKTVPLLGDCVQMGDRTVCEGYVLGYSRSFDGVAFSLDFAFWLILGIVMMFVFRWFQKKAARGSAQIKNQ